MRRIFIFLVILKTLGCGGDDFPEFSKTPYEPSDVQGPTVVSVKPETEEKDVPPDTVISVGFSESILLDSVNEMSFYIQSKAGRFAGIYVFSEDGKQVYLLPEKPLEPSTQYTIIINNRITDRAGNELIDQDPNDKIPATPFTSSFTTGTAKDLTPR